MKIVTAKQFRNEKKQITSEEANETLDNTVLEIIRHVRQNGDRSLYDYAKKFDQVTLDSLVVSEEEFQVAQKQVSDKFREAIKKAAENIRTFHQGQKEKSWFFNQENGVMLGQKVTPLDKVGVYVPGGKAAYPSTVLMNLIPAQIAGVKSIYITTPPQVDGKINPHVLVAAQVAGVDKIYKVGGAQAIAALAFGTETIEKVDKIVGPGNAYVARAKKWVYGAVAIDMIAGPSEICIVADETAPVHFVAADLLSQAEHDELATSICITTNLAYAEALAEEVDRQLKKLDRYDIAKESIEKNGRIIVVDQIKEALELANEIAPEHLQLMFANATDHLADINHAGAIFLGNYSPEPLGDYFAGPNHTLPTNGTARFASPLGVYDFIKKSSIIRYSEAALANAADHITTLANMEGLTAHANAITVRKDRKE